ncbi:MAG: nicotinate-nucleotide diphosphorylase (carboxylating), partial [candidate division WOR-3 bacterium]
MNKLKKEKVLPLIKQALREDIGKADSTTTKTIPEKHNSLAAIKIKDKTVLCGLEIVKWVFSELGSIKTEFLVDEGIWVNPGDIIHVRGNTRAILTGERVALNFIQRLCGISTYTRKFVDKIKNNKATILDT